MRSSFLALALLTVFALSACEPPPTTTSGQQQAPVVPPAVLGAEDVVEITVFMEPDLSGSWVLSPQGSFDFPLLGTIHAGGLAAEELGDELRSALGGGYLVDPQVQVHVESYNSRMVSVIGQVKRPGRYAYSEGITLVQAIASAGGTTSSAVLTEMQVTRNDGDMTTRFAVPFRAITQGRVDDFALLPGDIVVVHESAVK